MTPRPQFLRRSLPYLCLFTITCCITPNTISETVSLTDDWEIYRIRNQISETLLESHLSREIQDQKLEKALPAPNSKRSFKAETLPDEWFNAPEGLAILESIRSYQSPNGGWCKSVDFTAGPRREGQNFGPQARYVATFDNDATIPQIRLLARSYRLNGKESDREAALAGIGFILDSQYPNGGWPQIYPLAGDYHDCITLNDGAMTNILELALDIAQPSTDFAWLPSDEREEVVTALQKGIDCLLALQVTADGKKLGWAQQYDPLKQTPAPARAFEMTSLSSKETAQVLDFLIQVPEPSEEILAAVNGAADWLEMTQIHGYSFERDHKGNRTLIPKPDAKPTWARFYEIGTNTPLFGDRDGSIHHNINLISEERRNGYAWYTSDPASTLRRVDKWRRKQGAR